MAAILEQLKKSQNIKILAIAVILVIINIISLKFTRELFLKNSKLAGAVRESSRILGQGANTASLKNNTVLQIDKLRREIGAIEAKSYVHTEEVIVDLNRFAEGAKVNLTGISPQKALAVKIPESGDIYVELPIEVKLEGDFYELLEFLKKIEGAERLILVNEAKVRTNPKDIWKHDAVLSLALPMGITPAKGKE